MLQRHRRLFNETHLRMSRRRCFIFDLTSTSIFSAIMMDCHRSTSLRYARWLQQHDRRLYLARQTNLVRGPRGKEVVEQLMQRVWCDGAFTFSLFLLPAFRVFIRKTAGEMTPQSQTLFDFFFNLYTEMSILNAFENVRHHVITFLISFS